MKNTAALCIALHFQTCQRGRKQNVAFIDFELLHPRQTLIRITPHSQASHPWVCGKRLASQTSFYSRGWCSAPLANFTWYLQVLKAEASAVCSQCATACCS